jgi:hypothetical protein
VIQKGENARFEVAEFKKCVKDFLYFVRKYCFIFDPGTGKTLPFVLFPYQVKQVKAWIKYRFNVTHKSRRMGLSWLAAARAVWLCNFHTNQVVEMISMNEKKAKRLLKKCKFIYGKLPSYLKQHQTSNDTEMKWSRIDPETQVETGNNSEIISSPSNPDAGRSEGLSLLILDETAFIYYADDIWGSAFPTLATGGRAICISTANGIGNLHHQLFTDALAKKNDFHPTRLHWYDFPGRDQAWYDEQKRNLSPVKFRQEIDGDFIQSGSPVFDQDILRISASKIRTGVNGRTYTIGADPAEGGLRGDFSSADVLDDETGEQVHTIHGRWAPDIFAKKLFDLQRSFPGKIVVLRMNHGHAVILKLRELGAKLYMHQDGKFGWPENSLTKPVMIDRLEEAIRIGDLKLSDPDSVEELKIYQYKENGSTGAPTGYNDDRVSSLGAAWVGRSRSGKIERYGNGDREDDAMTRLISKGIPGLTGSRAA